MQGGLRELGEEIIIALTLHTLYCGPLDMQLSECNQLAVNLDLE
ncbi:putative exopolyphosphatase [Giardia duodenalis assemblage B]|uniref:Putative exopolyphosphatase n=1 Tax=Giardia duodenalis assemblage B TaxID=1394984 RepID=A0A132NRX3_GIAIN|nr:putative exopolyphosphatase [Giardia intestinalis assemblage B]